MNQIILFSPVGGTDPISSSNNRDGSLLHICRVYRPSKVIMYMSQEMLENQAKDDRYRYCLDRLAQNQGRKMEYEIIERKELSDVQEFDYFYQDFRKLIENITASMDESDSLILNISSGTPAMKSGLLVLKTLGEFSCKLVQVTTPVRRMNEHRHGDYDVKALWKANEDNKDGFENRCHEVECPTLSLIKQEEMIKQHISVYDYGAAVSVAKAMPSEATKKYLCLLQLAEARILLDFTTVDRLLPRCGSFSLPVQNKEKRKYFEYALNLHIKQKRSEYPDFIRAITPLIVDLFEIILKEQCDLDIREFTLIDKKKGDKNGILKWDKNKLKGTDVLKKLEQEFGNFKYGPVYSSHLQLLINAYSKNNNMKTPAKELRSVEEKIRNLAAHQIISVTDGTIKELTGLTSKQVMDRIKTIFLNINMGIKQKDFDSYDELNKVIESAMKNNY